MVFEFSFEITIVLSIYFIFLIIFVFKIRVYNTLRSDILSTSINLHIKNYVYLDMFLLTMNSSVLVDYITIL